MKTLKFGECGRSFQSFAGLLVCYLLCPVLTASVSYGQDPTLAEAILMESLRLHQVETAKRAHAESLQAVESWKTVSPGAWKNLTIGEFEEQNEFNNRVERARRDEEERYRLELAGRQVRRDKLIAEIDHEKSSNLSTTVGIVTYLPYVPIARWLQFVIQPRTVQLPRFDRNTASFKPVYLASGELVEIGLKSREDVVGRFILPETKISVRASELQAARAFKERFEDGQVEVVAYVEPTIVRIEEPILDRPAFTKSQFDEGTFQRNLFAAFSLAMISELTGRRVDNMYYEDVYKKIVVPETHKDGVRFHYQLNIMSVELNDRKSGKPLSGVSAAVLNTLATLEVVAGDVPGIAVGDQLIAFTSEGLTESPALPQALNKLSVKEVDLIVRDPRKKAIKQVKCSTDQLRSLPTRTASRPIRLPECVGHYGRDVLSVAISPCGLFVAWSGWSNEGQKVGTSAFCQLRVFDVLSGTQVFSADAGSGRLSFSPDSRLITVSSVGLVESWEISTGKKVVSAEISNGYAGDAVAKVGKSPALIVGGYSGGIGMLDGVGKFTMLRSPDGGGKSINAVTTSSDGKYLLVGVSPGQKGPAVELWALDTKRLQKSFPLRTPPAVALSFSKKPGWATVVRGRNVHQLNLSDGTLTDKIDVDLPDAEEIISPSGVISVDGKVCLAVTSNMDRLDRQQTVRLFSLTDGAALWSRPVGDAIMGTFERHPASLRCLELSPCRSFAAAGIDGRMIFLDLTQSK